MDKETKEVLHQFGQKLDVIAAILLRLVPKNLEGLSLKDQISLLDGLGVRPIEISKIIGRSQGYVSKELVAIRRKQK
jgi:hypothetical protein